ncbi:lipopolysaccharide biosynthesis protein RfbH [Desulfotignum phosphitoxidans]|uniref:CDP-6-deoxy-D-xylo-4-hexulose-3-dehydrase RfbH n=1 Tax=Desulfotignum phosphitoxidans DSM 13687 TaxID=1286635 RepID=S0FSI4_9BACT|nr:lipopolysaccharide biosynthesis protein RfbH [Desulfotignum phosphitoxidans]EMS77650.1 CDP-6-deoxy-D-xylo-4-hexulose-3-dehydrase RfbH [Desulfotignum phosphitoxidans DSM 13687]
MTYKPYTGKIFLVSFPFSENSPAEKRPVLAISEPDEYGDIDFLFITTKNAAQRRMTIDLPDGLLKYDSRIHCDKKFIFHQNNIIKELASIDHSLLKVIFDKAAESNTVHYYQSIHLPDQKKEFVPQKSRINYAGRVFDEQEMIYLTDSALEFWLTAGKYAQRFEKEFSRILNVKYCSLVNSGSSANLLALMALTSPKLKERRLCPGDEVITVAAGFPTTIAPVLQAGAVPVFVDVRLPDANADVDLLHQALSKKTKAVILAHTLGFPFDLQKIKGFCDDNGLWLIEDNCDALGSRVQINGQWHYTGTVGHIGTSSFYPPHHITMGEGGAVYTNDLALKRIVESFRDWGRDCWCASGHDNSCNKRFDQQFGTLPFGYDHKFVYSHFGYNLKVTDMQAAVGCAQLEKLEQFTRQRQANHQRLHEGLKHLFQVFHLPQIPENTDPSPFGFLLTVKKDAGFFRNEITAHLEKHNIQTRNLFAGNITRHPCFDLLEQGKSFRIAGELTNTDTIMHHAFWVGVYPGMTPDMIDYMVQAIHEFVQSR